MEDLQPLDNCEIFQQIRNAFTSYHNQKKKLQSFVYFSGKSQLRVISLSLSHLCLSVSL